MAKSPYALLIYRTSSGEPGPQVVDQAHQGHRTVQREASAKGDLHAVAKLGDADRAKTVRRRGARHQVTDGPYIETKEWLVGFYLVDCASDAEAVDRAKAICPIDDHAIEVRPVEWRWRG